jgi:hypothetical protein
MIHILYQGIIAILIASFSFVLLRCRSWKRDTEKKMNRVIHKGTKKLHDKHELSIQESMATLPFAIQRYLHKALFLIDDVDRGTSYMMHTPISIINNVKIQQEGEMFVNHKWLPFKATQTASCSPASPGFIWDCSTTMHPTFPILKFLPIFVRDAYFDGKGELSVNFMGIATMAHKTGTIDINSAELMRWLAEIALYPTAFLPQCGARVSWIKENNQIKGPWPEHHGAFVRGRITDLESDTEAEVQFCFKEDGLISSVRAQRMQDDSGKLVWEPWEGRFLEYDARNGMLVPTKMEAGYWKDGKLEIYFKGTNTKFEYDFFD